jgi:type IV pilus assembly protein PilC
MAIFDYKAKDKQGNTVVGAVEAPTENVATDVLKEKELIILSLSERRKTTLFQASIPFLNRVKIRDVVIFSRQLAVMISATVPIVQALRILTKQTENVTFKIIISEIADEVDGGAKLSSSLARYPQVFSDFFIHMVRSGETTGKLDETLNYLADQQEKDYDLRSKIRGALTYPIFIIGGMVVLGVVMMIFVIPKLTSIITESGAELPLSTKVLIGTSGFLQKDWWVLLIAMIALVVGFRAYVRTASGRYTIDRYKLRMPIFGPILRRIVLTRFAQSLSTLLQSGIPLTRSLEIVSDVIGNRLYKDLTLKTIKEIEDGNPLSTIFAQSKEVPAILTQMMNVGEQTGRLDQILGKLADFYSTEVTNDVENLVSLIQPLILMVLGVAVGLLVSAILLPIYNISTSM